MEKFGLNMRGNVKTKVFVGRRNMIISNERRKRIRNTLFLLGGKESE